MAAKQPAAFADRLEEAARRERAMTGGQFHKALRTYVDHPGIDQPTLYEPGEAGLANSTPVIGVEIDKQAVAIVLEKMADPKAHIVNFALGDQAAISLTYCENADCIRVFADERRDPIPLHVGGMDLDYQMVLLDSP